MECQRLASVRHGTDVADDGFEACVSTESLQNFADDELEQAELNCVACLHDMMGEGMMEQPDTCACFIQDGLTACYANKSFNKGRGKGSKGKYPIRPSNLSIKDRRKKLQEWKAKSECKACGLKGHWRGDRQCTMTKTAQLSVRDLSSITGSSQYAVADCTVCFDDQDDGETLTAFVAICIDDGNDEDDDTEFIPTALVAIRTTSPLPKPVAKPKEKRHISFVIDEEPAPMDWEFPEAVPEPPGSRDKFTAGKIAGSTFIDVTMKQPDHYIACKKAKTLTAENRNYVDWVDK